MPKVQAETLLNGKQLAAAMGMTYRNLKRYHLQRLLDRGLERLEVVGCKGIRYTASSWNRIIEEAKTDGKPL